MTVGKSVYKKDWIFYCQDSKPSYMKFKPKKKKKPKTEVE